MYDGAALTVLAPPARKGRLERRSREDQDDQREREALDTLSGDRTLVALLRSW
jgi:hypothetical protein